MTPAPKNSSCGERTLGPVPQALPFPNSAPNSFRDLSLPLAQSSWDSRAGRSPGGKRDGSGEASCRNAQPQALPLETRLQTCVLCSWGRELGAPFPQRARLWPEGLPLQWVGQMLKLLNNILSSYSPFFNSKLGIKKACSLKWPWRVTERERLKGCNKYYITVSSSLVP